MNTYIVWIEMNYAKIFKVNAKEKTCQILKRKEIKHHTSNDPENHKDCEKLFHEVAETISDASEILLIGPGLTKEHFKSHLVKHHHVTLANKVVGTKTMDLVSDAQLMAYSRKFFKEFDLFGTSTYA